MHRSHTVNLNAAQARKRAILDKDYKLQGVRARRRVGGAYEYLCVWEDFGPDGDTWEPFDHLGPHKKKVVALDKVVEVPFDRHRFLLQELIAKQLTSRKVSDRSAVYQKEMVVPFLVDIEVAEALLARMRRTRQGGALLPRQASRASQPRRRARGGPTRSARASLGTPSASSSRDGHPRLSTATCGGRGGIFSPMGSRSWPPRSPTREFILV